MRAIVTIERLQYMKDKNTMTAFEKGVWTIHNAGGVGFHVIASQLNRTENAVAAAWERANRKHQAQTAAPAAPAINPVLQSDNLPEYKRTFAACEAGGMSTQAAHDYATERATPAPAAPAATLPKAIAGGRVIIPQGFFLVPMSAQIFPGDYFTTPARDVWQLTANLSPADQNPFVTRAYIRKIA